MERYAILAFVAVLAGGGLFGIGYHRGGANADLRNRSALADSLTRAAEQARKIALQDAEVTAQTTQVVNRIRTAEKPVEIEVIHEIPADCSKCAISERGRGLLNDALSGRAFEAPGPGVPALPNPQTLPPVNRNDGGTGREIGRDLSKTI